MNSIDHIAGCIRLVCKHYNVRLANIPIVYDAEGIIESLKTLGFYACYIHTSMKGLSDCPKPVIVQTTVGFMTVFDASKISVKVSKGNNVTHQLAYLDFVRLWTGVVIVIEPPPTERWSIFKRWFN